MKNDPASVLVVDDDDRVLDTAAFLLDSLGYKVMTTQSSEEALALLRAHPIELLLTDIVLRSAIGGPDLARLAREANPGIAILYSTRYSPMFLLDSEAPGDGLLVRKPWDGDQLKAALSAVLGGTALARCVAVRSSSVS